MPPSEGSRQTPSPPLQPPIQPSSNTVPAYLWDTKDPDLDDALHNPDPVRDAILDKSWTIFSFRGWMNMGALVVILLTLIILFAGYPIIAYYNETRIPGDGYNLGGINGSGQVPDLPNMPHLIDPETPVNAYSRAGHDGFDYTLVFSDEFNTDGRSFYPGDDPFWEGVDLHYWATDDLEWYSPG
jgi:beta-glucan synthesis-associated protein KRE6